MAPVLSLHEADAGALGLERLRFPGSMAARDVRNTLGQSMRRALVPLLILALLAAACSNVPSEWRVRSQVVAALSVHGADQIFDVEDFRVVSGHLQDDGTYVASVHYDFVLKQGIRKLPQDLLADPKLFRPAAALGRALARAVITGTPIKVGAHIPVDDDVTLARREDGWDLQ